MLRQEMKFRKEAQGLFTKDINTAPSNLESNRSGTWGPLNISLSVERTAIIDSDEAQQLINDFQNWEQGDMSGPPPLGYAALYVPSRERERFGGEGLYQNINKLYAILEEMKELRDNTGMTNRLISPDGYPTVDQQQIETLVQHYQNYMQNLQYATPANQQQQQMQTWAIQDCEARIRILEWMYQKMEEPEFQHLISKFDTVERDGKPYVRIQISERASPALVNVFLARLGRFPAARSIISWFQGKHPSQQSPTAPPGPPPPPGPGPGP